MEGRGGTLRGVHTYPGPARWPHGRHRHQRSAVRPCRRSCPSPARPAARTTRRVRPRVRPTGPYDRRPGTAAHRAKGPGGHAAVGHRTHTRTRRLFRPTVRVSPADRARVRVHGSGRRPPGSSGSSATRGVLDGEGQDGRMAEHWAAFQYEIYLGGTAGAMPRLPTGPTRLEELAEHRLGASPVGHVAGSAGGRPHVYDLALDGQPGVEHVIRCLLAGFDLTLSRSRCPGIAHRPRSTVTVSSAGRGACRSPLPPPLTAPSPGAAPRRPGSGAGSFGCRASGASRAVPRAPGKQGPRPVLVVF